MLTCRCVSCYRYSAITCTCLCIRSWCTCIRRSPHSVGKRVTPATGCRCTRYDCCPFLIRICRPYRSLRNSSRLCTCRLVCCILLTKAAVTGCSVPACCSGCTRWTCHCPRTISGSIGVTWVCKDSFPVPLSRCTGNRKSSSCGCCGSGCYSCVCISSLRTGYHTWCWVCVHLRTNQAIPNPASSRGAISCSAWRKGPSFMILSKWSCYRYTSLICADTTWWQRCDSSGSYWAACAVAGRPCVLTHRFSCHSHRGCHTLVCCVGVCVLPGCRYIMRKQIPGRWRQHCWRRRDGGPCCIIRQGCTVCLCPRVQLLCIVINRTCPTVWVG